MAFSRFKNPLAAAPHIKQLPDKEVKRRYPWFRWRVMEATFLGYATFYLIRSNNLSVVAKDVQDSLNYSKSDIGLLMAITAATYGIGKFFMGAWSDRSDARKFMSLGLLLTALCNFAFGAAGDFKVHLMLWALNGLVQGMGWPPCGRSMGHWFSERERGLTFSIWNTSHNVGGGGRRLYRRLGGDFVWRLAVCFLRSGSDSAYRSFVSIHTAYRYPSIGWVAADRSL